MPDSNDYRHTANYSQFKKDNYGKSLHKSRSTGGQKEISYKELKYQLDNNKISESSARREMKNVYFESASEVTDAYRHHLINSGDAQREAKSLINKRRASSLSSLNKQIDKGQISKKKAAREGAILIAAGSDGKITRGTIDYIRKSVIPKNEHYATERLRRFSHRAAEFAGKTVGKGVTSAGRSVFKVASNVFKEQLGGSNGKVQDEALSGTGGSAKNIVTSGMRRTRSFAGTTFQSIRAHINYRKEFNKSTITEKDVMRIQRARQSGNSHKQKKADSNYRKKANRSNTHYASATSSKRTSNLGANIRSEMGKSAKETAKGTGKLLSSAGRFATRRFSKITTDAFGETDETLSSMGHAAKKTAKYTFKAARKIPKMVMRTVNTTRRVVTAVTTIISSLVSVITSAVTGIVAILPTLIPILLAALIVILVVVVVSFFVSLFTVEIASIATDTLYEFLSYADEDTIFEAEEKYCDAEAELSRYAASMSLEDAIAIVDPDNKYGLTTENTNMSYDYAVPYHNPYNLIAYLCAAYGEGWDIVDVAGEWDYNDAGSLIHQQYSIDLTLNEGRTTGSTSSVQRELVSFAEEQLGYPYVHGGRGDYMCPGYANTAGTFPVFDCSGLTAYVYLNVLGVQLPYNVADEASQTGQWYCGTKVEKGNTLDEFLSNLQVGDLIFMNSVDGVPGHVGMYIGDGEFINASSTAGKVVIESVSGRWNKGTIMGARRILDSDWLSNHQTESTTDGYTIKVSLVNNGMDATIRELLSDDELELYLMMCYYYGVSEDDVDDNEFTDKWPHDIYQTHDDSISLDEFLSGYTGSFNVDESTTGQLEYGNGYVDNATGFAWPLENYFAISSGYGWRWLDGSWDFHPAIDIGAAEGTPILASKAGTVIANEWNDARGWLIQIDHGDGYKIIYQHMCKKSTLSLGQHVEQGQVIGYVGHTGYSFGDHLHFEVSINNGMSWPDNTINPLLLFPDI